MVGFVGELEDIIVFVRLDEGLLFPLGRFLHYVSLVKVDQFVSLTFLLSVLVLFVHFWVILVEHWISFEQFSGRDVSVRYSRTFLGWAKTLKNALFGSVEGCHEIWVKGEVLMEGNERGWLCVGEWAEFEFSFVDWNDDFSWRSHLEGRTGVE